MEKKESHPSFNPKAKPRKTLGRKLPKRRLEKSTGRMVRKKPNPDGSKRVGKAPLTGDDYTMPLVCARALELYAVLGFTQREIPPVLHREFGLMREPCLITIQRWIKEAAGDVTDRDQMRNMFLERAGLTLRAMRNKFAPIAVKDALPVTRTKMKDGEKVTYVDEDGFREQVEAAKVVMRVTEIEAKMCGAISNEQKSPDSGSPASVNAIIIQTINQNVTTGRQALPVGQLALEAGDGKFTDIE